MCLQEELKGIQNEVVHDNDWYNDWYKDKQWNALIFGMDGIGVLIRLADAHVFGTEFSCC